MLNVIAARFGLDGAIAYTVLGRVIQAFSGLVSILFISKYLTNIEQGYYFTFGSILAIQIFFELGLSSIITQFVAHEMAHLVWDGPSRISGNAVAESRLSSLLHFCVKWFCVVAVALLFILIIIGFFFFTSFGKADATVVSWQIPYFMLCVSTSLSLLTSPILAFLEGLGKVKDVARIRLFQQVVQLTTLYVGFAIGLKLFASPVATILAFTVIPLWIFFSANSRLLAEIWRKINASRVYYKAEIFPYQWRVALSWISGYFIFQLFNPVLFATEGPVIAGQMGMTIAALNGISAISLSWVNTKVPLFSRLIAQREFSELDSLFYQTVKYTSIICAICLITFILGVYFLRLREVPIGNRFLSMLPLILLCIATFTSQITSAIATYLRCHKQEPFLILSIVVGLLTAASTVFLGKFYGVEGVTMGYTLIVVLVSLTWSLLIFKRKKQAWH